MTDALIVIDMQQGSFGPETPRHDAAGLVSRLNRLAASDPHRRRRGDLHPARRRRRAIRTIPTTPGWHLLPTLEIKPDDTVVRKNLLRCLPAHHARRRAARTASTG